MFRDTSVLSGVVHPTRCAHVKAKSASDGFTYSSMERKFRVSTTDRTVSAMLKSKLSHHTRQLGQVNATGILEGFHVQHLLFQKIQLARSSNLCKSKQQLTFSLQVPPPRKSHWRGAPDSSSIHPGSKKNGTLVSIFLISMRQATVFLLEPQKIIADKTLCFLPQVARQ